MDAVTKPPYAAAGAVASLAGAVVGYLAVTVAGAGTTNRMLPWILGRGLGWAAYACLVAATCLGLWLRHPWRRRWRHPRPESQLRVHAVLAAFAGVLLAGHVVALVLDRYAGVGLAGALVPGSSTYRPVPVALGTVAAYLGLLVGATAALAGRLVGRAWLPVHRVAAAVFALAWLHGILAGSDSGRLAVVYVATGAVVAVLAVTRHAARPAATDALEAAR